MKLVHLTTAAIIAMPLTSVAVAADGNPLLAERWKKRPVIVVTPTRDDALQRKIKAALQETTTRDAFIDREMVLYTVGGGEGRRDGILLSPSQTRALLAALELDPEGPATYVLVGKDGGVKMTGKADVDLRAVFSEIDRMPMRRRGGAP